MNLDALSAEDALLIACEGKSPELTIEICEAVIREANRIIDIAEDEIAEQEEEGDDDE